MFCLDFIRRRLAEHQPERYETGAHTREAAVAVILRAQPDDIEVLFIQRAEKRGDPWSGHMAFPGGHRDSVDADTLAAAVRETLEEVGLDLSTAEYLGALDPQRAMPRGRALDMVIEPHVFALDHDPVLTPNYEVQDVVWAPLSTLASNLWHGTETRPMAGTPTTFNGYRLERGHFVWGLTYRMLKSFFVTLDPEWRHADQN